MPIIDQVLEVLLFGSILASLLGLAVYALYHGVFGKRGRESKAGEESQAEK